MRVCGALTLGPKGSCPCQYVDFFIFVDLQALTLNDDIPGLDGDLDSLGDIELFLGVAIAELSVMFEAQVYVAGQYCHVQAGCASRIRTIAS